MRRSPRDYCILDDIPFERLPPIKAILGCQKEITLTDKYCRKESLEWGIPTIICLNMDMYQQYNIDLDFKRKKLYSGHFNY